MREVTSLINLHIGDVHDAPAHGWAVTDVAAEHIGDDDLGEVEVSEGAESGVVEVLRQPGVSATRDQNLDLRRRRRKVGGDRASEVGPVGVPFERLVGGSDLEELVPVFLAREVP